MLAEDRLRIESARRQNPVDAPKAIGVLLLYMSKARSGPTQLLFAILLLFFAAWGTVEAQQWLLRWRAERLLDDVRALTVDRSQWADVQPMMRRWAKWSTPSGACTPDSCNYRINIVQTLPPFLAGTPDSSARNWLPKIAQDLGLRSTAAHAGFTVEHGAVSTKWFGEQVTLPVQDWSLASNYIPYLSVLSGESYKFRAPGKDTPESHPNRTVLHTNSYMVVSFTPQEDPAERAALMDFQFSCITQLTPCASERDILYEAWRMSQEQENASHNPQTPRTR